MHPNRSKQKNQKGSEQRKGDSTKENKSREIRTKKRNTEGGKAATSSQKREGEPASHREGEMRRGSIPYRENREITVSSHPDTTDDVTIKELQKPHRTEVFYHG